MDDDGETGASPKMLFALQKMNAMNCVVIVSRWFGGIMLGNDRFRIIVQVAQEVYKHALEVKKKKEQSSRVDVS
jgi:putative IMPACT (imprinted ancient) family translation regulator